jgi:hypothetical protein
MRESREGIVRVRHIVETSRISRAPTPAGLEPPTCTGIDSTLNIVANEVKYKRRRGPRPAR